MAIIIGANTTVSFETVECVISANWGYNPNPQRLFCLGNWDPYDIYYRPTETLNITVYAPGPTYGTSPTTSCTDANTVSASVNPQACGGSFDSLAGSWWVTGYSFTKEDAAMPGQESWSLTKWKGLSTSSPNPSRTVEPDYVMRGIPEGQGTSNSGMSFTGDTTAFTTGSVSAGGFGKADTLITGVISSVGGGTSAPGDTGQGSASIPYTPLYVGT